MEQPIFAALSPEIWKRRRSDQSNISHALMLRCEFKESTMIKTPLPHCILYMESGYPAPNTTTLTQHKNLKALFVFNTDQE